MDRNVVNKTYTSIKSKPPHYSECYVIRLLLMHWCCILMLQVDVGLLFILLGSLICITFYKLSLQWMNECQTVWHWIFAGTSQRWSGESAGLHWMKSSHVCATLLRVNCLICCPDGFCRDCWIRVDDNTRTPCRIPNRCLYQSFLA